MEETTVHDHSQGIEKFTGLTACETCILGLKNWIASVSYEALVISIECRLLSAVLEAGLMTVISLHSPGIRVTDTLMSVADWNNINSTGVSAV